VAKVKWYAPTFCRNYRTLSQPFEVEAEITRRYTRFNAMGTQLTVRLSAPPDDEDPVTHFQDSMDDMLAYALRNCSDADMVGITIQNEVNQNDRPIGISFRRKDQLSGTLCGECLRR
jgi:hypothetical protein